MCVLIIVTTARNDFFPLEPETNELCTSCILCDSSDIRLIIISTYKSETNELCTSCILCDSSDIRLIIISTYKSSLLFFNIYLFSFGQFGKG